MTLYLKIQDFWQKHVKPLINFEIENFEIENFEIEKIEIENFEINILEKEAFIKRSKKSQNRHE